MDGVSQLPAHPQAATSSTPEEEALKRNTDCVYFLASPLTCKKGVECEYRHSEIARVNPRDCWYWLNANCLNPKCAFRHPPLDGLLGPQVLAPTGSYIPPSQTMATPVSSAPHNGGKQAVLCIFFQKGFCLKGDRCPFSHELNLVNSKAPQGPVGAAISEPSTNKKPFGGLQKCTTESKFPEVNMGKSTEAPLQTKPLHRVEVALAKDKSLVGRHAVHPSRIDEYAPKFRQTTLPVANGDFHSRANRVPQVYISEDDDEPLNNIDAHEISREPSPGFDVLVDDELRNTDYYHDEDHYERTGGNEGRNLNPVNDYESVVDVDRDAYRDPRRYDSFDRVRGQYSRDQRQVSSERISTGSERRRFPRADSPDRIDGSDLRYRLSKHRKVNGLRSVISHDLDHNSYSGDQSHRGSSRRDIHHNPSSERPVSNRLRGRINLPGRSTSPRGGSDFRRERVIERGNSRGRLSPGRTHSFSHQGRLQDRLKGRVEESFNDDGRGFRGSQTRERSNENNVRFAGPKSLSELRVKKNDENSSNQPVNENQQGLPLGKRKYPESYQQSEIDASFEGPKPLSEILKRKRAADINGEDLEQNEERGSSRGGSKARVGISSTVFKEEGEVSKSPDGRAFQRNASNLQSEEGLNVNDAIDDDQEHRTYAEGDGEYEYEQVEGEEEYFNEDEAEIADTDYAEDDDGDDFAKKIGVMFS